MGAMDVATIPIRTEGTRPAPADSGDIPDSRVPVWAYTDEAVYRAELERFFYRGHWCYVGLEAEIPKPGDFKRTQVGERCVIVVRDNAGAVHVVENVAPTAALRSAASDTATPRTSSARTTNGATSSTATCRAAVQGRRQAGRRGPRRHAGRLRHGGPRPHEAQGGEPRRRGLRLLRPRRRAARGVPRPAILHTSTACSTAAS